jgi:predicted kinase
VAVFFEGRAVAPRPDLGRLGDTGRVRHHLPIGDAPLGRAYRVRDHLTYHRAVTRTPQPGMTTSLLLTCGLPGSGKTTLARHLAVERDAQRFTKDEWVRDLGGDLWDEELRIRLEGKLIELAFELLAAGRSCILDFGLWSREERDALRLRARRLGVRVELHFLDVELAELVRRTAQRYADVPETAPEISAEQLALWASSFQAPSSAEQRLFDAPPAAPQLTTAAAAPSR